MPIFDSAALNEGVRKREVFGWAIDRKSVV